MPGKGDRGSKKEKPKDAKGALNRILRYMLPFRWQLILFCLCALLSNLGSLMGPKLAGHAINAAAAGAGQVDFQLVGHYVLQMLAVYVLSALLSFAVNIGMVRLSRRVAEKMRADVFDKLMRLPVSYFDQIQTGDIISRVSYDVDVIATSLGTDIVQIMTSAVTITGSFLMMCSISLPLVSCMLVTIPLSLFYTRRMAKKTRPLYAKRSASYGEMNGFVEEKFSGQKTILAYAYEDGVAGEFDRIYCLF